MADVDVPHTNKAFVPLGKPSLKLILNSLHFPIQTHVGKQPCFIIIQAF